MDAARLKGLSFVVWNQRHAVCELKGYGAAVTTVVRAGGEKVVRFDARGPTLVTNLRGHDAYVLSEAAADLFRKCQTERQAEVR